MKLLLKGLFLIFLLINLYAPVIAEELKGTVVSVSGLDVAVRVDGELIPEVGDEMEISFTIPDGESIPIGTWKITEVTANQVRASVKSNTGNPVVGHKAVIYSDNPVLPAKPQDTVQQTQNSYTYKPDTAGAMDEAQQIIAQMRSTKSGEKRNAARRAYKNFMQNPSVIAVAAEELEKGYTTGFNDKYHVDAMAWFCNILGASKDKKYMELLRKVYKTRGSEKIREFAKKNYKILK